MTIEWSIRSAKPADCGRAITLGSVESLAAQGRTRPKTAKDTEKILASIPKKWQHPRDKRLHYIRRRPQSVRLASKFNSLLQHTLIDIDRGSSHNDDEDLSGNHSDEGNLYLKERPVIAGEVDGFECDVIWGQTPHSRQEYFSGSSDQSCMNHTLVERFGRQDNADEVATTSQVHTRESMFLGQDDTLGGILPGQDNTWEGILPGQDNTLEGTLPGQDKRWEGKLPDQDHSWNGILPGPDDFNTGAFHGQDNAWNGMLQGPDDAYRGVLTVLDNTWGGILPA